jgi:hypothetical protein
VRTGANGCSHLPCTSVGSSPIILSEIPANGWVPSSGWETTAACPAKLVFADVFRILQRSSETEWTPARSAGWESSIGLPGRTRGVGRPRNSSAMSMSTAAPGREGGAGGARRAGMLSILAEPAAVCRGSCGRLGRGLAGAHAANGGAERGASSGSAASARSLAPRPESHPAPVRHRGAYIACVARLARLNHAEGAWRVGPRCPQRDSTLPAKRHLFSAEGRS